jgi:tryptophan 2,3-dioxygenase
MKCPFHNTEIGKNGVFYDDYIQVDTLFSAIAPVSAVPDEVTFIRVHQIAELVFALIKHELSCFTSQTSFLEEQNWLPIHRVANYFAFVSKVFPLLKQGMSKDAFLDFRNQLKPASGFQSWQYREIEIMLTTLDALVFDATTNENFECKVQKIYWLDQRNADALRDMLPKHWESLISLAKKFEHSNVISIFKNLPSGVLRDNVAKTLSHLESTIRNFKKAHLAIAYHYLSHDEYGTGGTEWANYLDPHRINYFQL